MIRRFLPENLRPGLALEWAMAIFVVGTVIYSAVFLWINSYLPQPFFFETEDPFADWFNTAYWARDPGTYDVWTSLYPPLSFVFLRFVTLDSCYIKGRAFDASVGYWSRDCDWLGMATLWGFVLLDIVLIYFTFRKIDRTTAIPRTICLGLGWPMLDGLERGNLVLVTFTCMILAFGPLLRSAKLKWLFAGLAVNFKVYLVAAIIPLLLKRRWRWVECALLATVMVYAVSFAILGRGTPNEIYGNLTAWPGILVVQPIDLWFSTTYSGLISLLTGQDLSLSFILGSRLVAILQTILPLLVHVVQAIILLAAAMTWLRPEAVPQSRAINLGLMLALITTETGGYSPIYFMLFVLMEPWRGFGRKWAILICYVLALSIDISIAELPPLVRNTYLRGLTVLATFHVTVSPFLRPLLILSVAVAISMTTIREVWRDIRQQGWAERWRFRRDAPLLPWIERPSPPPSGRAIAPAEGSV